MHYTTLEVQKTTSSTIKVMQKWLQTKNIQFHSEMGSSELLHLIHLLHKKYNLYVIEEIAKAKDKVVLGLVSFIPL